MAGYLKTRYDQCLRAPLHDEHGFDIETRCWPRRPGRGPCDYLVPSCVHKASSTPCCSPQLFWQLLMMSGLTTLPDRQVLPR